MTYTYQQIRTVSFPVMISVLTEQLINITDAIFLGHVGETELGASAIASIYYLAVYMLGFGFSIGLQVMIARKNGEEDYKNTGKSFFQGLYFLIVFAVFLFIISKFISPFILRSLITSDKIYLAVISYIDWRCFGLLFAFPLLAFRSFYVGIMKPRILTVCAIIMICTNILLNWILIFGTTGFAGLGISGAAIASTLAEAIALIVITNFTIIKVKKQIYGLKPVFDMKVIVQLLNLSLWSMLHSFIGVAPWFLFFVSIEHLGKSQLAIANILRSVSTLFFVIVSSLGIVTAAFVSNLSGAKKKSDIIPLCHKIIRFGYILGTPLIIIAFIFKVNIISVYTSDPILIDNAILPYTIMLLNYFIAIPAYTYCNAVMGTGYTKKAFAFQIITIVCYLIYLYFLSRFTTSLSIYWTAEYLFVILVFIFSFGYIRRRFCYDSKMKKPGD